MAHMRAICKGLLIEERKEGGDISFSVYLRETLCHRVFFTRVPILFDSSASTAEINEKAFTYE
jgi:hypothetical protein